MAESQQMLTVPEVAELMRVSEQTVRTWLRTGRLKGIRPGGTKAGWRIPRDVVEALLKGDQPTQLPLPQEKKRAPKRAA